MHATEAAPRRMSPAAMQQIAKSYGLGRDPKEIAAEHDITVHAVIALARRYDVQRRTIKRLRAVITPPRIETPEPSEFIERSGEFYVVHREGMAISLPMVSILREGNGG